jgi:NAD(P)-dependent dehydrogenase (short-subunit alcohol dehydrogenase family)
MDSTKLDQLFDLSNKVAVVTGGAGVLCSTMSQALAAEGVKVAVLDLDADAAQTLASVIRDTGQAAIGISCNVLDRASLETAAQVVLKEFGKVDILINGAGGNKPEATCNEEQAFFDLPPDAIRLVLDLNLMGTILASQVFGKLMANQGSGNILNISSMNAFRPLTRIAAYSAAKAGVSNFTQWLAVHMAQEYSPEIRVNAIAPGFFLTDQNRYLLNNEQTEKLTSRGQTIIDHTPMRRFGSPDDLLGTFLWLVSPASAFVTGIVVPVDGGFSAFCGV